MADKRISQLIERVDIANNDVLPIVASGATTTNKVTISTIQDWMQENLDVGVTSVGITIGSTGTDVNVTGSPITTSGNITINIPTASATNRGLLSSADWSTFNGKQNSITLTTSGTSGAATLVGSTLNIPNYSTGVANAYVPYVGAIGSVTLGYNSLSASQINIDGASPTGGSYLGFKHSTSVNTGTDGYTSMYTFGTNTIGFQSTSGGTSKAFAFSMVGITAGVPGGRQYTLPDASGTLALTSDLSGYVTLGTAQTITAQKTFTTSGGDDTLIVNHTSGSGIAVDISKAGNGEGLRVAKTSGTGNAVTISGGLLSAEAATLTGALNGTSAIFTGGITSTGTGLNPSLRLTNTTASTGTDWHLYSLNNGNFGIYNNTAGAYSLQIASTGAATFSSSVNIASTTTIGGVDGSFLRTYSATNDALRWAFINSSTGIFSIQQQGDGYANQGDRLVINRSGNVGIGTASNIYGKLSVEASGNHITMRAPAATAGKYWALDVSSANQFYLINNTGSQYLTITDTGAATFSSSVKSLVTSGGSVITSESTATNGEGQFTILGKNSSGTVRSGSFKYDNADILRIGTSSPIDFRFETNDTERMRITAGGDVGIGTASPSGKLDVIGSIRARDFRVTNSIDNTVVGYVLRQGAWVGGGSAATNLSIAAETGNGISFYVNGSSSGPPMFLNTSGNLGIGTASPSQKLVVQESGDCFIQVRNNTAGQNLFLGALSGEARINNDNATPLTMWVNGSERMRLTSGGYLWSTNSSYWGSSANHQFNTNANGNTTINFYHQGTDPYGFYTEFTGAAPNNTSNYFAYFRDTVGAKCVIFSNGNIQNLNNSYGAISDAKLKENIEDATPKLDDLMKVKVRNYNLIGDDKKQIGVIAQELEEVFPAMIDESEDFEEVEVPQVDEEGNEILNEEGEVVTTKERVSKGTTTKSVKYSVFVPMLIKAMQEQQEQIKSLTEQVEALKSQING